MNKKLAVLFFATLFVANAHCGDKEDKAAALQAYETALDELVVLVDELSKKDDFGDAGQYKSTDVNRLKKCVASVVDSIEKSSGKVLFVLDQRLDCCIKMVVLQDLMKPDICGASVTPELRNDRKKYLQWISAYVHRLKGDHKSEKFTRSIGSCIQGLAKWEIRHPLLIRAAVVTALGALVWKAFFASSNTAQKPIVYSNNGDAISANA